jgi:hypothetical protein
MDHSRARGASKRRIRSNQPLVDISSVVVNGVRYMTLKEYAAWKRVSYWTVRRAKLRGEITTERIGKSDRIPVGIGAV